MIAFSNNACLRVHTSIRRSHLDLAIRWILEIAAQSGGCIIDRRLSLGDGRWAVHLVKIADRGGSQYNGATGLQVMRFIICHQDHLLSFVIDFEKMQI